ncbi:MAG: Phospholipase/carboxylesterase [Hydrocarboniphaga sp.]|uniref:alpha/beta hydrolase n=1 Tax=Hydrocarboniphaga sp. TaxID=2033016 RepID=UPI002633D346|nr:carboxylesterase [Hydrocarboniphaga sp.]MDB5968242.1 Phospholipase/carboxylesterase [Hydrocarboniphaga sp.]
MKKIETVDRVVLEPTTAATAAIIWLHGLGADGHDFVPLVPALMPGNGRAWRFIFPHAAVMPVSLNGGMPMRSWFDIVSLDRQGAQDVEGIRRAQTRIDALIAGQIAAGVPSERILLAGFSQGGAVALHTALRYPKPLAGLLALSTYLPMESTLDVEGSAANRSIAILMQHGLYDPVLPLELGSWSRDRLLASGYGVGWNEYPMQHEVCEDEIEAIGVFLRERLV